jgi:hypothetical protein
MGRPQSRHVKVDPTNPLGAGQCDLCGRWWQLRELRPQQEWAGTHLYTFYSMRCRECWDIPQEQLRTIILPPDPPPLLNARVPNFAYEEQTVRIVQRGSSDPLAFPNANPPWNSGPQYVRSLQGGQIPRILQLLTSS